jgi:putative methyltransferase (TIGR04325 family)
MNWWRSLARNLTPPILLKALRARPDNRIRFIGKYSDWKAALAASHGYATDAIFEKTRDAAMKVARGEAVFERDSALFDHIEYSFPVIAALLKCACAHDGRLSVLDFGGALGTTYRQFKAFNPSLRELRWSVVEQPRYASYGRAMLENDELHFFDNIAAAVERTTPNVVLLSGVLQYLQDPHGLIREISVSTSAMVIVDRTFCSGLDADVLSVQSVPPSIYDASYPCWIFSTPQLLRAFADNYQLAVSFTDTTHPWTGPDGAFELAGFVFEPMS